MDIALNVLPFVPLGIFPPVLYERFDTLGKIAFAGFLISFFIEIVQMFGFGTTDICMIHRTVLP